MIEIAGYVALFTLTALGVFQLALIGGASLGRYAWGGQHDVLPVRLRVASASSILLYLVFGTVIADATGRINTALSGGAISPLLWTLTIYFSLGVILNAVSRSHKERQVMTPVALVLALCCLAIAMGT